LILTDFKSELTAIDESYEDYPHRVYGVSELKLHNSFRFALLISLFSSISFLHFRFIISSRICSKFGFSIGANTSEIAWAYWTESYRAHFSYSLFCLFL